MRLTCRRCVLVIVAWLCAAWSATTFARWDSSQRPGVALADAHSRAVALLDKEKAANPYCIYAQVLAGHGMDVGDRWNLQFLADGDQRFDVTIGFDGEQKVRKQQERLPSKLDTLRSMDDLEAALKKSSHLPEGAQLKRAGDTLTVSFKTRPFWAYDIEDEQRYSAEPRSVAGPGPQGFLLQFRLVTLGESRKKPADGLAPYWKSDRRFYPGFSPDTELIIDSHFGAWGARGSALYKVLDPPGVSGATYEPARVRPKLSLLEAHAKAIAVMPPEDAKRYYGTVAGLGAVKPGVWTLMFHASDGSTERISVNADGRTSLSDPVPKDFSLSEEIGNLDDVERLLPELLKSQGMEATFTRAGKSLTIEYGPRIFKVHPQIKQGHQNEYAEDTIEVRGPDVGGIIITIEECENLKAYQARLTERAAKAWIAVQGRYQPFPFFQQVTWAQPQALQGPVYLVDMQIGAHVVYPVEQRIIAALKRMKP
jgi:hypothetical protein